MKLHHGGRLRAAVDTYGIPLSDWLDFSTAINPQSWPVPPLPLEVWQRLPEDDDGLLAAATRYYGVSDTGDSAAGLPVPGTQAVIETLPRLLAPRRVWVPAIGYQEHAFCWQKHGHALHPYTTLPDPASVRPQDVVVVINPNNPTAERVRPDQLRLLATALAPQMGLLVVDEAFMDCTPEHSLLGLPLPPSTLVLRSFGKFFGLAGLRLGFCFAAPSWIERLDQALGPWAVNHPARWIARQALADSRWQLEARKRLRTASTTLQQALATTLAGEADITATDLFVTLHLGVERAEALHTALARQGLFTRWFSQEGLLRIGVDAEERHVAMLLDAITAWGQRPSR